MITPAAIAATTPEIKAGVAPKNALGSWEMLVNEERGHERHVRGK